MSCRMGRFPNTVVPLNSFAPVFEGIRRPGSLCREPRGLNGSREEFEQGDFFLADGLVFLVFTLPWAEPGGLAVPGDMNCDCMGQEGKTCLSTAPLGKL